MAALKLIHGLVRRIQFNVPTHIEAAISSLSDEWKNANRLIPCAVYQQNEAAAVDRISCQLTHGKGERAGRDRWNTVAKARHNRDRNGSGEPGLDLLEKYLKSGQNITAAQKQRWAGEYSLTVLNEALQRLAPRIGFGSSRELADSYPKIKFRAALEKIFHDIGTEIVGFEDVWGADFAVAEGIPTLVTQSSNPTSSSTTGQKQSTSGNPQQSAKPATTTKARSYSVDDPRAVSRALKKFAPVGNGREKVVRLLNEAKTLNVAKHPHAFCFLLRSMFELSAKAYCDDHAKAGGPTMTKPNGEERKLADILRDITKHLTNNNKDKSMVKVLHRGYNGPRECEQHFVRNVHEPTGAQSQIRSGRPKHKHCICERLPTLGSDEQLKDSH